MPEKYEPTTRQRERPEVLRPTAGDIVDKITELKIDLAALNILKGQDPLDPQYDKPIADCLKEIAKLEAQLPELRRDKAWAKEQQERAAQNERMLKEPQLKEAAQRANALYRAAMLSAIDLLMEAQQAIIKHRTICNEISKFYNDRNRDAPHLPGVHLRTVDITTLINYPSAAESLRKELLRP